jgi:hypothetical protein
MSQKNPVIIEEIITRKVATLMLANPTITIQDLAKRLEISKDLVKRIQASDRFRELLKVTGEDAMSRAVSKTRQEMAELAQEAVRVIKFQLQENNLEAAKIVLKTMGLEQQEKTVSDTQLTVIIPGQTEPKDIEAEFKKEEV